MLISIAVTYHPDLAALERQLVSLKDQVDQMLVVDNGSPAPLQNGLGKLCEKMGATLHLLPTNTGIGHAQNLGIQHALKQGAQWLLLFDQDSLATPDMANTLRQALQNCPDAAAAGAQAIDQRTATAHSCKTMQCGPAPGCLRSTRRTTRWRWAFSSRPAA